MFPVVLPTFTVKTIDELHSEPDEVSALVYLEDAIAKELVLTREYNKDAPILGQIPNREEEQQSEEEVAGGSPGDDSGDSEEDDDADIDDGDEADDSDEV